VPDWELAGDLVSALLGTAAVATVYLMTREAFARRDLAVGAATLTAIHPELAAYSASVRTEAGYIFLATGAIWLLLKGLHERRLGITALSGAVGGLAYLYRTEGIGLLVLGMMFMPAAEVIWRRRLSAWALGTTAAFATAFLVVAAPYLAFMRISTGHWTVGHELTAAMMYGMADVAHNSDAWRHLGFSPTASPLVPVFANPGLYLEKVCGYFVASFYNFLQALGPLLTVFLAAGLWTHGRRIFAETGEAFLALTVVFYFCGFALSYTGTRFMIHLIPYTFGWVIAGFETFADSLAKLATAKGWRLPQAAPALVVAFVLLPQTLWPIGYDMRGIRYAGEDIAKRSDRQIAVVARDGRVAYYADARFVGLPAKPIDDLCHWLGAQDNAGFLVIGERDERRFEVSRGTPCLEFVKRYPRYGSGYYDLYAVRRPDSAAR